MHEAEIYVVRVYRRDAGEVAGVVEHVGRRTSATFRTAQDLVDLILGQSGAEDAGDDPDAGSR